MLVLVSFTCGLAMAFWLSKYRISGVPLPSVTVEKVAGEDALVVSVPEHPPLAQSSFYGVDFDYQDGHIDISEIRVLWNPFSRNSYGRPPVVIRYGLLPKTYRVRYWNGERFVLLGTLTVEDAKQIVVAQDGCWRGSSVMLPADYAKSTSQLPIPSRFIDSQPRRTLPLRYEQRRRGSRLYHLE